MALRSRQDDENVRVLTETDAPRAWRFTMAVPTGEGGGPTEITVLLSWVDYEYWSHGQKSPASIAEAVVRSVLESQPERVLPEQFDASTARRWVRDLDERMREW